MQADKPVNLILNDFGHQQYDDEPKIPARRSEIAVKIFDRIFNHMFRQYFTSVRVKNKQHYYLRNVDYANLFYGYHGCWWDGPLAALICRNLYKCNLHMMIKDLYRFPVLSKIGAFSIEKDSMQGKLKAINYTARLLENPENSVWIFPQGRLVPLDQRPVKFESGIAHISNRLKGLNLIPIAYKYTFLQNAKPEIFVEIGKPIIVEEEIKDKKEFLKKLQQDFEMLLDKQSEEILQEKFKEYKCILFNDFNWIHMVEKNFKPIIRKKF